MRGERRLWREELETRRRLEDLALPEVEPWDDASLFERMVNWGIAPVEHFHADADDITWTGWAAYTGFATPTSLSYGPSAYSIGHNAIARAFRYISVTPAAEQKELIARVAVTYSAQIGIMVDDGVDNGDGNGADNFVRVHLSAAAAGTGAPTFDYQYRTGGGGMVTSTYPHSLVNDTFYGLWISTRNTEWSSWNPRVMLLGEAYALAAANTLFSTSPAGLTWTPARIGIFYQNLATSVNDRGIVDWFHHTY